MKFATLFFLNYFSVYIQYVNVWLPLLQCMKSGHDSKYKCNDAAMHIVFQQISMTDTATQMHLGQQLKTIAMSHLFRLCLVTRLWQHTFVIFHVQ